MVNAQSEHQKHVLEKLTEQPLIARKTMQGSDGRWLGLRPWRFEVGAKETILNTTVQALRKRKLVEKVDCGDRLEIRLIR